MTERDKILGRIREALQVTAPMPGTRGHTHTSARPIALDNARSATAGAKVWLPPVGVCATEWIAQFARNSAELKTTFLVGASAANAHTQLQQLAANESWKRIASHSGTLSTPAAISLNLPLILTDNGFEVNAMESCDAGITECDALVAQTGSVLLTARSGGGRALSVLPPHHVVIARIDQLVPDLPAAYDLLHQKYGPSGWPSMMTLITGPSRTGDIERIIILGAHGPKKLTIIVF